MLYMGPKRVNSLLNMSSPPYRCKFPADFVLRLFPFDESPPCPSSLPGIWNPSRPVALSPLPPAPQEVWASASDTVEISPSSDLALCTREI